MKQKFVVLILAIILVVQLLPTGTSFAATNDSADSKVVRLLEALGIMTLDEQADMLWDETPVKRREIAQIICNIFKIEPQKKENAMFRDVDEKYRPYVEEVVELGYMKGYDSEHFGPDDYITNEQLIKVFVSIAGADRLAQVQGGYPYGYVTAAQKMGIVSGHTGSLGEYARRIDVAQIIYDTLHADMLQLVGIEADGGVFEYIEGETFLTEKLNIFRVDGVMNMNDVSSLEDSQGTEDAKVRIGDEICMDTQNLAEEYLGYNVTAYVHKQKGESFGDIIYIEEASKNITVSFDREDFVGVDGFKVSYYQGDKVKSLSLAPTTYMIYNGVAVDYDPERLTFDNGYVKLIDNDDDNRFDVIVIVAYKTYVVAQANVSRESISLMYGEDNLDLRNNVYSITRNGIKAELEDIKPGEVLLVAESDEATETRNIQIESSSKRVSGMVQSISEGTEKTVRINDTEYTVGTYCEELMEDGKLPELSSGMNGLFYLDARGNIAYFTMSTGNVSVGYMVAVGINEEAFNTSMRVQIYTPEGTMETYETEERLRLDDTTRNVSDIAKDVVLMRTLKTPQLVQYRAKDGRLTMLDLASEGYSADEFSKDADGSLKCSFSTVLDQRYTVTADTLLFNVPQLSSSSSTYVEVMTDPNYFRMYTGTYFVRGSTYNVKLYDVDEMGSVKYAVRIYNPHSTHMWEGNKLILVTNMGKGVDADGNEIRHIYGMNEEGKEVELVSYFQGALNDPVLGREIKAGDVVQYVNDTKGRISAVLIQHSVDDNSYCEMTPLEVGRGTGAAYWKVFGDVYMRDATRLLVSCVPANTVTSPVEANMLIGNTGKCVLKYDRERGICYPIKFSEIEYNDKVFAAISDTNNSRMIVVYQ